MIEQRCPHGFIRSKVRCDECAGTVQYKPPPIRPEPDTLDRIIQEVTAELGITLDDVRQVRMGRKRGDELAVNMRARAEIARRAKERYGIHQTQVAQALGLNKHDIWYALKRCG